MLRYFNAVQIDKMIVISLDSIMLSNLLQKFLGFFFISNVQKIFHFEFYEFVKLKLLK